MDTKHTGGLQFPGPGIEAVVFDLDGVVTDTALVHEAAWRSIFDEYLRTHAEKTGQEFRPFTSAEYGRYVDGKPRYEGAGSFIASRGIELPTGDPSDPPGDTSVAALANRKNERFLGVLEEQPVQPFPETVRVIRELRGAGVQVGLITSSRNGRAVLKAAGVTSLFNAIIDGVDAAALGLAGKPEPDIFLAATEMLGSTAARTAIVEDAQSGVEAGRRGGFGLVLGVDRLGMAERLFEAGADAVVQDLGEIEVTTSARSGGTGEPANRTARDEESGPTMKPSTPQPLLLSKLPSAMESQTRIAEMLREGRAVVFLDYDGTLSPIVDDPAAADMPAAVKDSVERLAAIAPVAIVSGRDLRDVRTRADVEGVFYAGSHGFEIVAANGTPIETHSHDFSAYLPALDAAEAILSSELEDLTGVIVERKRFAIAVHFRMADPGAVDEIERAVERARDEAAMLRITGGKKIFELRPDVDWDKGAALEVLLGLPELGGENVVPLYVGDDLTDEDGFRAVHAHGGIAVAVQGEEDRLTIADYGLDDPLQVGRFLSFLAAALEGAGRESRP